MLYTNQLIDYEAETSFIDAFHRTENGMKGDWYASQQDATVVNHLRLGIGTGTVRGLQGRAKLTKGHRIPFTTGFGVSRMARRAQAVGCSKTSSTTPSAYRCWRTTRRAVTIRRRSTRRGPEMFVSTAPTTLGRAAWPLVLAAHLRPPWERSTQAATKRSTDTRGSLAPARKHGASTARVPEAARLIPGHRVVRFTISVSTTGPGRDIESGVRRRHGQNSTTAARAD